ncbi:MAG: paraquat-inducible protein A [Pseudomonadota bacterium]
MDDFSSATAQRNGVHACPMCTKVLPNTITHCSLCDSSVHHDWEHSLQLTWAWLITSVILYVPANILPIMRTSVLGKSSDSTILGGVVTLWEHGSYPIASVIFIASVLVPLGKIVILAALCFSVHGGHMHGRVQRTVLYRLTELVGRWSMIDVFVVAILVALIQLGNLMNILPGPAALAFAATVITTMLAAQSFDPRQIWYANGGKE